MGELNLNEYLYGGIERIIKGAMKATLQNPKESLFLGKYAITSKKAAKLREEYERKGIHIPSFLIASITTACNLHCAGCYARANHSCSDTVHSGQLSDHDWNRIFQEANEIGVSFILLAGGEPLLRKDVIDVASKYKNIMFPIFTNGTMLKDSYLTLFDENRNLVPILSIEGAKETTDLRRGNGVYDKLVSNMEQLKKKGILFGASVTVTNENREEVLGKEFTDTLALQGCKVVIYVEYVPVSENTKNLALSEEDRDAMEEQLLTLRKEQPNLVFVSFPGDEKSSGGCLAAGRGFFHINASGGAEPCPFSPYSDCNVIETSLIEALQSPLFIRLQEDNVLMKDHIGGCVLFEQRDIVEGFVVNE